MAIAELPIASTGEIRAPAVVIAVVPHAVLAGGDSNTNSGIIGLFRECL